jgi:acetyl-CoA synthetase
VTATERFRTARDFLLQHRLDYERAYREFAWPRLEYFNWALDWFDVIARDNAGTALRIVAAESDDLVVSFEELRVSSNRIANHLRSLGLKRGERVLLMIGNAPQLWASMLACMKLGCPVIPASTLLATSDLQDRAQRGQLRAVIAEPGCASRFATVPGAPLRLLSTGQAAGWGSLDDAAGGATEFQPECLTDSSELMLLYFTSGTTARPKLVPHTHASYPIGHLSTMYWAGLRPGDVHLNLSSPGWAKHAWSCLFAPWNAEATVVAQGAGRFDAKYLLEQLVRCEVTVFCAPPTVWRSLVQLDLSRYRVSLREALSAGEPLNAEIIRDVEQSWGITVRDGYGQTETTLQCGNFPGRRVKPGAMGQPAPGYVLELLDANGAVSNEGEIAIRLRQAPVGLTAGYLDAEPGNDTAMAAGFYRTGDAASRDTEGYLTYIGRNDDLFKSSDYRISPFELESALIEHPAVVEAAVVPSPDAQRLAVPKAFIVTTRDASADRDTALEIFRFIRSQVSAFKRIRRIEFSALPKTISGKIRRAELRGNESTRMPGSRATREFWEQDFPELATEPSAQRPPT